MVMIIFKRFCNALKFKFWRWKRIWRKYHWL